MEGNLNKLNKRGPANTPSIKDGCCRCDGGDPNGNKPSHIVDGKTHTSCNTLSGDLKQICSSSYPNSVGYEYLNMAKNFAEDINISDQLDILVCNATKLPKSSVKYDLIFMDPPYAKNYIDATLNSLIGGGWVADNAIIVVEVQSKQDVNLLESFNLIKSKSYGNSKILILEYGCC